MRILALIHEVPMLKIVLCKQKNDSSGKSLSKRKVACPNLNCCDDNNAMQTKDNGVPFVSLIKRSRVLYHPGMNKILLKVCRFYFVIKPMY